MQDNILKCHHYFYFLARFDILYRQTLEVTTQEVNMTFVYHLSLERIAYTLLLHDMDVKRFDQQTYFLPHVKVMVVLHDKLITVCHNNHLIMHSLEDRRSDCTRNLCSIRKRENIPVFRANHHIHRHILTKTFVHTFKLYTGKTH